MYKRKVFSLYKPIYMTPEEIKLKGRNSLSIKERTNVAKERLLAPDESINSLSLRLWVSAAAIKKVEGAMSFNEESAVAGLMNRILAKDNQLLEIAGGVNVKFASQVEKQRTLKSRDVDTLDKITNSAMKRAALIAAANSEWENNTTEVNITLTF